jgi:hypothetical protein
VKGGRKMFALPRLHPKESMGRNEACWCLSGKKWKHCHRDREALSPVNVFESFEAMRETFAEGYCRDPPHQSGTRLAAVCFCERIKLIERAAGKAAAVPLLPPPPK